jgi:hypothetical protein
VAQEQLDGVCARDDPLVAGRFRTSNRVAQLALVVRRHDLDHRQLDRLGALRRERAGEVACLPARARDEDALAEQRPRVEPAQLVAEPRDFADDGDGGRLDAGRAHCPAIVASVPVAARWRGSVPH